MEQWFVSPLNLRSGYEEKLTSAVVSLLLLLLVAYPYTQFLRIVLAAGNGRRQINLMVDFGTTMVHIMPSFALYLVKVFEEMGVDPKRDTKLRVMFLGDEPVPLGEI